MSGKGASAGEAYPVDEALHDLQMCVGLTRAVNYQQVALIAHTQIHTVSTNVSALGE